MPNAPEDGEFFDLYAYSDEQREQESAALRERNFLLELKARLGDKVDEDVIYSARDALVRKGAEVTPEALATEYSRLRTKFTVVREPNHAPDFVGYSRPKPTKLQARQGGYDTSQQKPETFVQTIKKRQKLMGIYAY